MKVLFLSVFLSEMEHIYTYIKNILLSRTQYCPYNWLPIKSANTI